MFDISPHVPFSNLDHLNYVSLKQKSYFDLFSKYLRVRYSTIEFNSIRLNIIKDSLSLVILIVIPNVMGKAIKTIPKMIATNSTYLSAIFWLFILIKFQFSLFPYSYLIFF